MSDSTQSDFRLASRVTQLEAEVAALRSEVQAMRGTRDPRPSQVAGAAPPAAFGAAAVPDQSPSTQPPAPPPPLSREQAGAAVVRGGEYWFNKIGIGLLLLGLAFLFNYAIDQGWLTPAVRVGLGLTLGAGLLGLGWRLAARRPAFGVVLMGGGVASWYLSIFAAFQIYALVSYPLAFAAMCLVTALAFGLSLGHKAQMLALIATVGGLATPFLLYRASGSVAGLVGYTGIVLAGAAALYLARGWRGLLWTATAGGWAVLLVACIGLPALPGGNADRWAVEAGLVWAALLFWLLPLGWAVRGASRGQPLSLGQRIDLALQALATPAALLGLSAAAWDLSKGSVGWLAFGLAALCALLAWLLRQTRQGLLAYAHAIAALLLVALGLGLLLEGNALLVALATEAALILLVAGRWQAQALLATPPATSELRQATLLACLGHLLFGGLALALLATLGAEPAASPVLFNMPALSCLAVLALAVAASLGIKPREIVSAYWLIAHGLLLALLGRELLALPDGNAYLSIAWGLWGLLLLVLGLRIDRAMLTLLGIGTLLLVVAKLLLIDLAALAAIWRVLLFLGFGGAFLLLSYYLRALWRPQVS